MNSVLDKGGNKVRYYLDKNDRLTKEVCGISRLVLYIIGMYSAEELRAMADVMDGKITAKYVRCG